MNIGNDVSVRDSSVIGIFDMDNATLSSITRKFLSDKEKKGDVYSASFDEIPKSFILYLDSDGEHKICFSQFSSSSLKGRMGEN